MQLNSELCSHEFKLAYLCDLLNRASKEGLPLIESGDRNNLLIRAMQAAAQYKRQYIYRISY